MELKEAREIAKRVVPKLLFDLPEDMKFRLIKPGENEDALLFRLTEKAASSIQEIAIAIENRKRAQYI